MRVGGSPIVTRLVPLSTTRTRACVPSPLLLYIYKPLEKIAGDSKDLPSNMNGTGPHGDEPKVYSDGYWAYGRYYGESLRGQYLFPIDSEELNRLDLLNKVFLVAREDRLYTYALNTLARRPRILDLGTGTAIWAMSVAEENTKDWCEIEAVDLHLIQPQRIPREVQCRKFDLEEPSWEPLMRDCDLVHMRLLFGSIRTELWPDMYRKAIQHVTPGQGYFEQVEIDWEPSWEDSEIPPNSALRRWSELFVQGMEQFHRSVRVNPAEVRQQMQAAGFTDIREETIKLYVNPGVDDRHEAEIGRWFNLAFCHGMEAMSLMPLIQQMGQTPEQVSELCSRVKEEICILRYHPHCKIYIWTAKRPHNV